MRGQNRGPARFTLFIAVLASLAYLGGGIALMASSQSFGVFPEKGILRYGLGILLLLYGGFRMYRSIQQLRNEP